MAGLGFAAPIGLRSNEQAQTKEPDLYEGPYYLVFNASGGWDTTYLMDPKGVNDINRLYRHGDILTKGAHRFAPNETQIDKAKGISNETFFSRYGSELLVLNGLDYSVNNHSPCQRYMATGKLDSHAYPTFAALAAACKGSDSPLAFLTFGNYSATGNIVPMARVPYLPTLKLLAKADHVQGGGHAYHEGFVTDRIDQALKAHNEATLSKALLPRVERSESMLYSAQLSSKTLKHVTPYIPDKIPKERLAQQAEIALASFKAGVCVSANLSIGQFDSHANNDPDQMNLIPEFLQGIDHTLMRAEELGIRDELVVVIQSEMARTPHYNKGNGKDHWSIGSIMFIGSGIEGNRVVGKTDEGQFLIPIDPKSHQLQKDKDSKDGIRVRPEHIHQSLRELAGIDKHALADQFPLKVKRGEELKNLWVG